MKLQLLELQNNNKETKVFRLDEVSLLEVWEDNTRVL